jgi:hypothetical protein
MEKVIKSAILAAVVSAEV